MFVTEEGMEMDVKLLHSANAPPSMLVTPSGIVMVFKLLHPMNA